MPSKLIQSDLLTNPETASGTILTYGTFDLFHHGHVKLLRRLAALGDKLIVGVSTDEFNAIKGKEAIMTFEQRCEILLACRYVDGVFPEDNWDQKRADIVEHKADIFAMGDDWEGHFDDLGDLTKVVYLARTPDVSTSELRRWVKENQSN